MKTALFFVLTLSSSLVGCVPVYSEAPVPVWEGEASITNDQLKGTWQGDFCSVDGFLSYQTNIEFSYSGALIMVSSVFDNTSCAGPVAAIATWNGSYWLGDLDSFVADTTDADISMGHVIYVSPADGMVAANFNQANLCGFSAWQSGVTEALIPSPTCFPSMMSLPQGHTLVGISGDRLFFGNGANTDIDGTSPYEFVGSQTPDLHGG
jgi:hypothetical protein